MRIPEGQHTAKQPYAHIQQQPGQRKPVQHGSIGYIVGIEHIAAGIVIHLSNNIIGDMSPLLQQ